MCNNTGLNLNHLFVAQNGIMLEPQLAKTATLASFSLQTNGLKGATTMIAMWFCV